MKLYIGNHRVMRKPARTSGIAMHNRERLWWRTRTTGQMNHNVANANHSESNHRPGSGPGAQHHGTEDHDTVEDSEASK
jgi:hypothetical protein